MKILMVCLGNICRSPLAHGILEKKIKENNIIAYVDSAGTGSWHAGEPPDHRSIETAANYGIDISQQKARQFTTNDFEEFDLIYVMDSSNYRDVSAKSIKPEHLLKVKLILNEIHPNENRPVPDPYYGGAAGFEKVYQMLDHATDLIIEKILKNEG